MKKARVIISGILFISFFAVCFLMIILPRGKAAMQNESVIGTSFVIDGTLEADQIDISSKIPGRISEMTVIEGDYVESGQVVVVLESEEIDAKYEQAEAGVRASEFQAGKALIAANLEQKNADANVRKAKAGVSASEASLEMAKQKLKALETGARPQEKKMVQQKVKAAKAAFDTAEKTWKRVSSLTEEGVLAQQKADEVEMKYKSAEAQLTAAEAQMNMVNEGARIEEIEAAKQQVRQAEAGLEASKRTLDQAEAAMMMVDIRLKDSEMAQQQIAASEGVLNEVTAYKNNTRLVSPISGRISQRMSRKGEIVSAGYSIMSVVRTDGYWVEVYIPESKLAGHKLGEVVNVEIPALGRIIPAKITKIYPAAIFGTARATNEIGSFDVRSIQTRITLMENPEDLVSGLTARIYFD